MSSFRESTWRVKCPECKGSGRVEYERDCWSHEQDRHYTVTDKDECPECGGRCWVYRCELCGSLFGGFFQINEGTERGCENCACPHCCTPRTRNADGTFPNCCAKCDGELSFAQSIVRTICGEAA